MVLWFSNHVYKIIILPTLVITIPNLEIFLFCQHNSTGGGNLELRQTIEQKFGNSAKVHSRWIFPAKLLSRCKPAPPFLVIFTLSCFIRDRAIESDLTSLILNVSLTGEIKSQIF
jgi:hypothetical protein